MKVLEAAGAVLLCAALSLSLGAAGRAGLLLRIRRQYLHEGELGAGTALRKAPSSLEPQCMCRQQASASL